MIDPPSLSIAVIAIDDRLYRCSPRETVRNGNLSRGAYHFRGEPDPSVSVDLARLTTPEAVRQRAARPERLGVGELLARIPLKLGLTVKPDPVADNPAHCLIEGAITRAIYQTLADHTVVVLLPQDE